MRADVDVKDDNVSLERFLSFLRTGISDIEELDYENFFRQEKVQRMLKVGCQNEADMQSTLLSISENLAEMDVFKACMAGYIVGLYGGRGVANCGCDDVLIDFFTEMIARCIDLVENTSLCSSTDDQDGGENGQVDVDELFRLYPDDVKAYFGTPMLAAGVISRIVRCGRLRDRLRCVEELFCSCEVLSECMANVGAIPYILRTVEYELVVVISPVHATAIEVEVRQVDNNFMFFTLLQLEMYHRGILEQFGAFNFEYNESVEDLTKSGQMKCEGCVDGIYDTACFGYYNYLSMGRDCFQNVGDPKACIVGTDTLYDIPRVDGRLIVLTDKPEFTMSWGKSFIRPIHPAMSPSVRVSRIMDYSEFCSWMDKVSRAAICDER